MAFESAGVGIISPHTKQMSITQRLRKDLIITWDAFTHVPKTYGGCTSIATTKQHCFKLDGKPARMSFDGIGTTVRKLRPPWMRLEFGFVDELSTPYLTSTHVVGLIGNVDDEKRTHVCIASPLLFGKCCTSYSHHEQTSTCLRSMWQDMVIEVIEGIICTWSFTTE
jgi:hypothetical protein